MVVTSVPIVERKTVEFLGHGIRVHVTLAEDGSLSFSVETPAVGRYLLTNLGQHAGLTTVFFDYEEE